jgi:hypothetical protein
MKASENMDAICYLHQAQLSDQLWTQIDCYCQLLTGKLGIIYDYHIYREHVYQGNPITEHERPPSLVIFARKLLDNLAIVGFHVRPKM